MKADDQTILSLHTRVITHNPRISVTHDDNLHTWQLHIRQLKESDRGCYMCQINTNAMKKQLGCVDVQGNKCFNTDTFNNLHKCSLEAILGRVLLHCKMLYKNAFSDYLDKIDYSNTLYF